MVASKTWTQVLAEVKKSPAFTATLAKLNDELSQGQTIYPSKDRLFQALKMTPFDKVKVVILGQDPYHGPKQAHGLAFSVPEGIPLPPSLDNILKELQIDLGIPRSRCGDLSAWATQGVLLLNSVLSVRRGQAGSHQHFGWQTFTDTIIDQLSREHAHLVFLLWGAYAQKKRDLIDENRHLILCSTHPSPLSAHRGFLGCRHFSKTNDYLQEKGLAPINWNLDTAIAKTSQEVD